MLASFYLIVFNPILSNIIKRARLVPSLEHQTLQTPHQTPTNNQVTFLTFLLPNTFKLLFYDISMAKNVYIPVLEFNLQWWLEEAKRRKKNAKRKNKSK